MAAHTGALCRPPQVHKLGIIFVLNCCSGSGKINGSPLSPHTPPLWGSDTLGSCWMQGFWLKQCPCWINHGTSDTGPAGINTACGVKGKGACAGIFRNIKSDVLEWSQNILHLWGLTALSLSSLLRSCMWHTSTVKHLVEKWRSLLTACLTDLLALVMSVSVFESRISFPNSGQTGVWGLGFIQFRSTRQCRRYSRLKYCCVDYFTVIV